MPRTRTARPAPVNFDVSRADADTIRAIAARAHAILKREGMPGTRLDLEMDLTAAHANGCPLRLADLLAADDATFGHDVFGIRRHLDRTTGQLGGCFFPRLAVPGA